jgi:hypothetical protein
VKRDTKGEVGLAHLDAFALICFGRRIDGAAFPALSSMQQQWIPNL